MQPSQLAANALRSCSITQQQLAGLDGAAGAAGGAAVGTLLFVDPELLQLEDSQQRSIMVQGLKVCMCGMFACGGDRKAAAYVASAT